MLEVFKIKGVSHDRRFGFVHSLTESIVVIVSSSGTDVCGFKAQQGVGTYCDALISILQCLVVQLKRKQ
jgi:hypothetical protein